MLTPSLLHSIQKIPHPCAQKLITCGIEVQLVFHEQLRPALSVGTQRNVPRIDVPQVRRGLTILLDHRVQRLVRIRFIPSRDAGAEGSSREYYRGRE